MVIVLARVVRMASRVRMVEPVLMGLVGLVPVAMSVVPIRSIEVIDAAPVVM
jgi:hypothetical protein